MKRLKPVLLIIILLIPLTSCSNKGKKRYEAEFLELFDTMTKIVGYADSKEEFTAFSNFFHDEMEKYHKLYDIYNNYEGINNIKTINDNAGIKPVKVDRKIIDLLIFSKEAYSRTSGQCNIALGAVLKIWHNYREKGTDDPDTAALPPMDKLKEASYHTNIENIEINESTSEVYQKDPEMSIDVGAVAKGYATEMVCREAQQKGYNNILVSVGGNIRAIGGKTKGNDLWKVGIRNPDLEEGSEPLLMVGINDKSVVTSGIYERYYTVGNKNYHHIIDPETLMPSEYFKAVTIICKDSGIADELSTAVFCMPLKDGLTLIESLPDTEALWVLPDGKIKYSKNFRQYIKNN